MKSFWKILALIQIGIIIGLIASAKLGLGVETILKGKIKIKQKGEGNIATPAVETETPRKMRKSERILERLERKKARAQEKLLKGGD